MREDGSYRLDLSYFNYCQGLTMTNDKFASVFGQPARSPETDLTQFQMDVAASIQEVTEEVRRRFPEKFGNPRREKPNRVEGGGTPSGRSGKKGYADLPPEAKAACDRFVKQGLMTKEEYVKDFDWSE